jgi:hypothetical protein
VLVNPFPKYQYTAGLTITPRATPKDFTSFTPSDPKEISAKNTRMNIDNLYDGVTGKARLTVEFQTTITKTIGVFRTSNLHEIIAPKKSRARVNVKLLTIDIPKLS